MKYKGKKTRLSNIRATDIKKVEKKDLNILKPLMSFINGALNFIASISKKIPTRSKKIKPEKVLSIRRTRKVYFRTNTLQDFAGRAVDYIRSITSSLTRSRPALIGIAIGLILAFIIILIIDFQKVKSLANFQPNVTTKIYDQNGILISELFTQKRGCCASKKNSRKSDPCFCCNRG